ncbi:hypothetical protein [Streptomyces naphthomycinicus]|uniref:hypothetical protein n=1 Tax=Streptomyces naphthomycinicus TaxID=2872625 RepID=UPI001CECD574|nr:hypothetical protein [Streptomyces sp. TML10]
MLSRTKTCQWVVVKVTARKNGRVTGTAQFTVKHLMTLKAGKRDWSETVAVSAAKITGGGAKGIHMSLKAKGLGISPSTKSTTTPKVKFQSHTLGEKFSGSVSYHDSIGKKKFQRSRIQYTYHFTKPGYTFSDLPIKSQPYRCDDMFWEGRRQKHTKAAGCVFYDYTPTVSFKGLKNIAGGIKGLRNRGGHYGQPGKQRLHITWDQRRIKDNRKAVCPASRKPPERYRRQGRTSCDEYPMASIYEGGTYLPANQRETTWATPDE